MNHSDKSEYLTTTKRNFSKDVVLFAFPIMEYNCKITICFLYFKRNKNSLILFIYLFFLELFIWNISNSKLILIFNLFSPLRCNNLTNLLLNPRARQHNIYKTFYIPYYIFLSRLTDTRYQFVFVPSRRLFLTVL